MHWEGDGKAMRFLESLIYGFLSGLAEFLPVSAQAHEALVMQLFGRTQREPLRDLFVHIALIVALTMAAGSLFAKIRGVQKISAHTGLRGVRSATAKSLFDLQLVRTAAIPMILMTVVYLLAAKWEFAPGAMAIILILNGILIIVPEYMRHGNKDARSLTAFESVVIGIASGLSAFPGISRVGGCLSASSAMGADRQHSAAWALLLSLPALVAYIVVDIIRLFVIGLSGLRFLVFLGYIVSAGMAFVGGYLSVLLLRFVIERRGLSSFAFYSWGMALFVFVLYLIT